MRMESGGAPSLFVGMMMGLYYEKGRARLMPGNGWASLRRGRVPGRAARPSGEDAPGVEGGTHPARLPSYDG